MWCSEGSIFSLSFIRAESKYCGTIVKLATAGFKLLLSLRFVQSLSLSSLAGLGPLLAYAGLADILFNIGFVVSIHPPIHPSLRDLFF